MYFIVSCLNFFVVLSLAEMASMWAPPSLSIAQSLLIFLAARQPLVANITGCPSLPLENTKSF